jgi:hypothetical protein
MNADSEGKCAFQLYIPTRTSFFTQSKMSVGLRCAVKSTMFITTTVDYIGIIIINNNSTIQR